MGNNNIKESIKFDRVIDGEAGIWIGVNGNHDTNNPMSTQKLCLQNEEYKKLKFFTKSESGLTYEFENDIVLRFYKNPEGIYYNFKYPIKEINETKLMNSTVCSHYRKIGFNSNEFDQIYDLINQTKPNQLN
jgi:hypothetical protein